MIQGELSQAEDDIVLSNFEKSKAIEALLIGSGAHQFRDFENRFSNFCPFEAVGMVRQEIRHAHFLSFILDPNRPHPFQDHLLKGFIQEVIAQAQDGQVNIQPLTIHCSDFSSALIYRERSNIDFMIEIPPKTFPGEAKGLVVTVELKVDAPESKHQLGKYYDHITADYPADDWERAFVFLTLDATAPTEANSKSWIPVSIVDVINRLDLEVQAHNLSGEAVNLFKNYSAMVRRHLVDDENMAQIAKSIWAKHREALEALYEYWPDLQAEVIDWIKDNPDELAKVVKEATGFTLVPDTSSTRLLRFGVSDWSALHGFQDGDTNWVKSGSLMVLELADWGNGRLRFSFVLGPGDADVREDIYQSVLKKVDAGEIKIGRRTRVLKDWKHFSAADVQTEKEYAKAEESEITAEELGRKVMKKMAAFLKVHLPTYDNVLKETLKE
ncbi:PD-(D/E)XK nuclease family protein [Tateyamaria pelophila]|uniref:PD-(D/E)XK nuclease family protein n=1 Tax=Tateyamaria pelophila TaxID=328415 RepID=UPI001CBA7375|nr:PD-(D/E)XK nuclease family protein [Tateyamaria pelophila]